MFAHLRRMAFFDEAAIPDRVYYIGGYSALESNGLDALVTLIRGAIQKHNATLLVVDGLVSAQESSPTDREFKKFLHEIQTLADLTACTVLLLTNAQRASGFFPEHTMVDGVLHLTDELSELRPLRHIRVLKLRGSAPVRGLHSVRITDQGLEVLAENRNPVSHAVRQRGARRRRAEAARSDLPSSTSMLRGGVRPGSITMLLGSSGSGKTAARDAVSLRGRQARRTRRCISDSIERPEAILAKCQRVGIGGLQEGVERGTAQIVWHRPVEGVIDELGESLIETVRNTSAAAAAHRRHGGLRARGGFSRAACRMSTARIAQELEQLGRHDALHHRNARAVRPDHRSADQRAVGRDAEHHSAAPHRASRRRCCGCWRF